MSALPINLIVFSTTMGHDGRHTYKETIENLFDGLDSDIFANKVLHLKTRQEEEEKSQEIKDFCDEKEIRVIETKEDFVHHSENHLSHSAGYFKDINKAFSDLEIRKQKYSFWLEDDWLLKSRVISLKSVFKQSIQFLEENPNSLCVRFNKGEKFTKASKNSIKENHNIYTQGLNYTKYGPTFTFQPTITKTTETFIAWQEGQRYLDILGKYHCEIVSGRLMKLTTNSETPFSFFNPNKIYSEHIG